MDRRLVDIGLSSMASSTQQPQAMDRRDDLPTTEQFFAKGTENGCGRDCVACCFDCYRICCEPSCCCRPRDNAICCTAYNCCAGGSAGVFIWPLGCPCGLLTCCCPLKICDIACCVCKTPDERCDSIRYIGQRFLFSGMYDVPALYPFPPGTADVPVSEADAYNGRDGPYAGATPNRFVSFFESLGDLMTSVACLAPCFLRFNAATIAPNTTYAAASKYVGSHDRQMNDNREFGGVWVYPKSFGDAMPTPPSATDDRGDPLPTNVAPGAVGSRVIFWAHGSAFAITQAADFVWLFGQLLAEQTGQVILLGEYPLTSSVVAPAQLDQWTRTYTKLVELYGAENVIVAGDSAGGNLALATLLATSDALPPPGGLALFSPWIDLRDGSVGTDSMRANPPENGALAAYGTCDYLPPAGVTATAAAYANAADRETKLVSPAAATDAELAALGAAATGADGASYAMKVFVTFGTAEILFDQQAALAARLAAAGVATTAHESPNMPHDSACVAASVLYTTGLGFLGVGEYSDFAPAVAWVSFFDWLATIPGWEDARAPAGWLPMDGAGRRRRQPPRRKEKQLQGGGGKWLLAGDEATPATAYRGLPVSKPTPPLAV